MGTKDWEQWMWQEAQDLLRQAERIRSGLVDAAVAARTAPTWGPSMNVLERDDQVLVVAALPGVAKDEVRVELHGPCLVVSGRRTLKEKLGQGRYLLLEIPFGHFERRLHLPVLAQCEIAHWELAEGLLRIELRRTP